MKYQIFDYAILGGGCSALSLISKVCERKIDKYSFLIIEERVKYNDDRSWCFWLKWDNTLKSLISYSWKRYSFSYKKSEVVHFSKKYSYQYVRSIDFYRHALKKAKKKPYVTLRLGESVIKVTTNNEKYFVHTNKNKYFAKNIIDTRPKKDVYLRSPFLFQSFLGYEIEIKEGNYKFKYAKIMDNMRMKDNTFFFDYILPFGTNKFLVEITAFSKKNINIKKLKSLLTSTLKENNFENYKIIRREFGIIPMGFIDKNVLINKKNYFFGGMPGGAVRPSSGYAFLRIQEWAEQCVNLLERDKNLISHPNEKVIIKKLDMIFLKVITNNLKYSPFIFFAFAKKVSTDSFIRFMSGDANIMDYIKI